jgi:nucleoside-diphosphate-sugar epimerase
MTAAAHAGARCLVMGGNRYIGLSLVHELVGRGHEVTVMNSHPTTLPEGVRRLHGDRRQPGVIAEVLGPYRDGFDVVFDNTSYVLGDLEPMVDLFAGRVRQFVFTSTVAVYRRSLAQPIREDFPRYTPADVGADRLRSYGAVKAACEDRLLDLCRRTGFPATCVRVSHTLGPRSPLASREPSMFSRLEHGRPILVPGEGFPFVHLIHIDDAARLMASVIGNERAIGEVYNVAGRDFASVVGHIELMAQAVGVEARIVRVPLPIASAVTAPLVHWAEALTGGMVFDITKTRRDFDCEPIFDLAAGYRDSYDWFRTVGRHNYEFDFSAEDRILSELPEGS